MKMTERVLSLSGTSRALWKGARGCCAVAVCKVLPTRSHLVKFPTKAKSWQTVLNSNIRFLSVLHPKCSDHRRGRGSGWGGLQRVHTQEEMAQG